MQTKKRAKPVTFGKTAVKKTEKKEVPTVVEPVSSVDTSEVEVKEEITVHKSSITRMPHHSSEEIKKVVVAEEAKELEPSEDTPEPPSEPEEAPVQAEEDLEDDVEEIEEDASTEPEAKKVLEEAESVLASAEEERVQEDPQEQRPTSRMTQSTDSPFDDVPLVEEKRRNPFLYFLMVAFGTFFVGLAFIVGANVALEGKQFSFPDFKEMLTMQNEVPTPEPTKKATPTPKPVDLTAYTIKILNGSGVTGEASKLKESLTSDGFKVGTTGNADATDYEKTQITVKKDVDEGYVTKLKEALEKSYKVSDPVRLSENASAESDVTVTIGSETAQ